MARPFESWHPHKPVPLDVAEAALSDIPKRLGLSDEPMYEVNDYAIDKLRYLSQYPMQTFCGEELYKTLPEKLAILFYTTIKNHYFANGNKRTAVVLLLIMLYENNKWVQLSTGSLVEIAKLTSKSKTKDFDETMSHLVGIFDATLIDIPD